MKNFLKAGMALMGLLLASLPGFATEFLAGSEKEISRPVSGDLYVSGGNIVVNAPITGDFISAGGTIILNDSIMGDVLLAGGEMLFNGYIGDDLRAAGGQIALKRHVQGDVVVAGGQVDIGPQVVISGDLVVTGGKVWVNGHVKGHVKLLGGQLYLNGKLDQSLTVKGGKLMINGQVSGPARLVAEQITLQDKAEFHQPVEYWQQGGPINFSKAMVSGKATYRPDLALNANASHWYYLGFASLGFLLVYLASVLLLLFLLQFAFSLQLGKAGRALNQDITRDLGYGLLYLIGLPFLSVLLLITVIGIPVGLFALLFYLFTVVMAHIITSLVIANWYDNQYRRNWTNVMTVWAALGIFIALKLITLIPFAGWLVSIALIILAFGAIIDSLRRKTLPGLAHPV